MWKTQPIEEKEPLLYPDKKEESWARYRRDPSTDLWMVPEINPFKVPHITEEDFEKGPIVYTTWHWEDAGSGRKVEWVNFYNSDDYVKDKTTNLMKAAVTEETCKANGGFVCKVRLSLM